MFFFVFCVLLLLPFYFSSFGTNYYPSESYSIEKALPLRVPPIAHDDGFLVSFCITSYLHHLNDIMWKRWESTLISYALIASLQGCRIYKQAIKTLEGGE